MVDLMLRLRQQTLSVRELAAGLELPLSTVEGWAYSGATPSPTNQVRLEDFMCTHHWVIDAADGHLSRGVCDRRGLYISECRIISKRSYADFGQEPDMQLRLRSHWAETVAPDHPSSRLVRA